MYEDWRYWRRINCLDNRRGFDDLDARPIRLSSQDIPTPYNGNLENLTIIQPHQIIEKVEDLISGSI